jgi:hypothetical protein
MNTAENLASTVVITGTVKLGTTTYSIQHRDVTWTEDGVAKSNHEVRLLGPRGSLFLVRPFLYRPGGRQNTGLHQVINLKSGAELRSKGNLIRVVMVGDIIEQAK